ncbi:MAG: 4Fe-4S dicluster domain-containing protein [Candidatus Marinimicrobia bacterium]|nr:4Fe-4S dicluster domain-containing protein [Candidatus Neomarinimicrobiota bacterium]
MSKAKGHVVIREDECKGCELCIYACPVNVLSLSESLNKMGYHPAVYQGDGCIGCGFCFYTCPELGTITVFKKWDDITEEEYCPVCKSKQKVYQSPKHPEVNICTKCLNEIK